MWVPESFYFYFFNAMFGGDVVCDQSQDKVETHRELERKCVVRSIADETEVVERVTKLTDV